MNKKIKLFDSHSDQLEEKSLIKTIRSGFWASGAGIGNVKKFEDQFKKYVRAKECVALNSGTAALHLGLSIPDIKNKEVILPSLSFVSTAHAIIYNGGKPVFVDVKEDSLCIDYDMVDDLITSNTKVILPVHFGGFPCDLNKIMKLCKKHNLTLVEDAAHATGAIYDNKKIGSHGDIVCFSFHPVKNLAMPTGGAITLNLKNSNLVKGILNTRRWCGISDRKGPHYDVKELGWNYYMNEFSAAVGLIQLKKLSFLNKKRKMIAKRYANELHVEQHIPLSLNCSYHLYWILVKNRNNFIKKMSENNIETGIHYKPIHKLSYYRSGIQLPVTNRIENHIVTIPMHPNLDENDVSKIIKIVNKYA